MIPVQEEKETKQPEKQPEIRLDDLLKYLTLPPLQVVAFTGHRPHDLPAQFGYDYSSPAWRRVIDEIKFQLVINNAWKVITGMAQGLDTAAAIAVLELRNDFQHSIQLQAEVPFVGQEDQWDLPARELYHTILRQADIVHYTITPGTILTSKVIKSAYHQRNHTMVDQADTLIALYNGSSCGGTYSTVKYALKKKIPIINIWDTVQ